MQKVNDWLEKAMFDPEEKVPLLSLCMILAAIYAIWKLFWKFSRLSQFVCRHCCRKPLDLLAKYGSEESYVVVTGGSDGIGLEICHQMAEMGFNICMVSRNEEKMK